MEETINFGRNKWRGKIGNVENYMDFHVNKLVGLCNFLMLFTLNFAPPVSRLLGRYLLALIFCLFGENVKSVNI